MWFAAAVWVTQRASLRLCKTSSSTLAENHGDTLPMHARLLMQARLRKHICTAYTSGLAVLSRAATTGNPCHQAQAQSVSLTAGCRDHASGRLWRQAKGLLTCAWAKPWPGLAARLWHTVPLRKGRGMSVCLLYLPTEHMAH
jgi:hypothetical protein